VESEITLENLDVQLLMWDMRRNLDATPMPKRRSTIEFLFTGVRQSQRQWWRIVTPGEAVELCSIDPGFDLDLYIACDLRTMTAIWMGLDSVRAAGIVRASLSGYFEVLMTSINVMQDQITRARLAGEPPHVMLVPRLRHIGLMEFNRADETIAEGRAVVDCALPLLRRYL
jgi:hypothetical protein